MTRLVWAVAIATAFVGCKREKGSKLPNNVDAPLERNGSAMWREAPAGTHGGLVIAPGAGAEIHRGFIVVAKALRENPAGSKVLSRLLRDAAEVGFDPVSIDGLSAIGINPSKGAGLFMVKGDGAYAILPVSDRLKFRGAIGGEERGGVDRIDDDLYCAPSGDLYRCAPSADKLAAWQRATQPVDAGWPNELRGSIELLVTGELLSEAEPVAAAMQSTTALRGAVRLERGGILARFSLEGTPTPLLAVEKTPLAAAVMKRKPSALIVGDARALIDRIEAERGADLDVAGPGGISPRQLIDALTGEVVVYAPTGEPSRGYIEIGIKRSEPFKKLATLCGLAPPIRGVSLKQTSDGCEVTLAPPQLPDPIKIPIEIGESSIIAGLGDSSAGRDGKVGALPDYLTRHEWLVAMWLRGSVLTTAEHELMIPAPQIQQALAASPEAALGLWAVARLSELGGGLRTDSRGVHGFFRMSTTWRNPPEVVAELEPLLDRFAGGDLTVVGDIKKLAARHGGSPLATDLELGRGGGVPGAAIAGVLAAVAVPAFVKYVRKSKTTEARVYVKKMYDGARAYYLDPPAGARAHFPKTSTPITPPLGTCCAEGGTCAVDSKRWTHQTWRQLRFSLDDPHYYSYQYEVAPDGASFTARALGDLDCDGEYSTFEMYGAVQPAAESGLYRENDLE